eukprot:scaffold5603_cov125-Isochrysis_galbana.AAC.1
MPSATYWSILHGDWAHHVARRWVARAFLRGHVCRGRVGRPGGRGSGARVRGLHLHTSMLNPKIGCGA